MRTAAGAAADDLPRAPLWIAGVALFAACAWWPVAPYWQSDDFLAVTYGNDLGRALADFTGPQYAAPALVLFYRPLITLSFAFDVWLAGAAPMWAHLSNTLAHVASTLLVVLLARRTLSPGTGARLGLLWALWPTHAGSILWAVGRVDSHTTVWILLAAWATVRWLQVGRGRGLALTAFVLALLSKELAFVVPGLVALLGFALAPPLTRLRRAWQTCWPFLVVFAVYMGWRRLVLGRLVGGYQTASFAAIDSLRGLSIWCARVLDPLLDAGPLGVLAFGVWPLALVLAARRRRLPAVGACLLWFAIAALATAPFWAETAEIKNVRYFYLPAAGLLGVVALGGWFPTMAALLIAAGPWLQVRRHYLDAHRRAAAIHAEVLAADALLPPGRLLVQGLPHDDSWRQVLMFHLFVDRLLLPPFGSGRSVLALRPLVERPGVERVPPESFTGLPDCHVLEVETKGPPPAPTAPPTLQVEVEGSLHLSSTAIWDLHLGRARHALRFLGDRSPCYRLTLLTAGGYVACVLPNETPDAEDGSVSLGSLLGRGRYATTGDDAMVAIALGVPATFDVDTRFPLVVEGGQGAGGEFLPRSRTERPLLLQLDRDYQAWLRGEVGDPRERR